MSFEVETVSGANDAETLGGDGAKRALSYNQAIEAGLDPQAYAWEGVPVGEWEAVLDFKIWGKATSLGCYFTARDGRKYKLNAFPPKGKRYIYTPKDGGFDMSQRNLDGGVFVLTVHETASGKVAWQSATLVLD